MTQNFLKPITGCIGQPVAENPTQAMIEAAYDQLGLDWRYITFEVAPTDLAQAAAGMRALGFAGFNCTIPHKVAVIEHLDGLGESARLMQAVNCVVRRGNQLIGENTDGKGFLRALLEHRDPMGSEITIVGAGGAARAIAIELGLAGARRIRAVNRSTARANGLGELLRSGLPHVDVHIHELGESYTVPRSTDVLINATSVGLYPNIDATLPIDLRDIAPSTLVADVIFNPADTDLLRRARSKGCDTIDGLDMLVGQGIIGVNYWTGQTPDAAPMRAALQQVLEWPHPAEHRPQRCE